MKSRLYLGLLLTALGLGPAIPAVGIAADGQAGDGAVIRIDLRDGLLSAEIKDAPLPKVLEAIGKLAGFEVVRVADFNDFPRVDGKFDQLPVQAAVERLVADTNRILFFSGGERAQGPPVLSRLWLLAPGEEATLGAQNIELIEELQHEEAVVRSQAALRLAQRPDERPVMENLALLLQTDPNPLVRSRVAIALGALGDVRAVPNLEAALRDDNFSVRAQSITALGQIGGERAVAALGSILANDAIDAVERVVAAQALWNQDSETAMRFLESGRNDANEQVREAASLPPAVFTGSSESGSVVAQ